MQVANSVIVEPLDGCTKRFPQILVMHIVKDSCRGNSHANTFPVPYLQNLFRYFGEKPNTVRSGTPIKIPPLIGSSVKKPIDQIAICRVNLDPVESSFLCVMCS